MMDKPPVKQAWSALLVAFSAVMLGVILTLVLAFYTYGTSLFDFLFYNASYLSASQRGFEIPWWLEKYYEWTTLPIAYLLDETHFYLVETFGIDTYGFSKLFFFAPLFEELHYRGPLRLLKRHAGSRWWMALALILAIIHTLAHKQKIGILIPVFAMSFAAAWLVKKTQRWWPSFVLHVTFNIYAVFKMLAPVPL